MARATVALKSFFEKSIKDAEKLQSFVIDEIGLTELLERAWLPVGKKLIRSLKGVIDFNNESFDPRNGLNMSMWMTDDMFDNELKNIWAKIEKQAKKFIERAYDRGIEEQGQDPFSSKKIQRAQKSVSSVYAERKERAVNILLNMVKEKFTSYARETAIPAISNTLDGLGRIELLSKSLDAKNQHQFDQDAAEIARFEMLRKMRILAQDKARAELIAKLKGLLTNCQVAAGEANMSVSRAHHFGFLDWASENGIEYYEVSAKLDAKTCPACAMLDGKVFRISDALEFKDIFLRNAGDKAALKEYTPFLTKKDAPNVRGIDLSLFAGQA